MTGTFTVVRIKNEGVRLIGNPFRFVSTNLLFTSSVRVGFITDCPTILLNIGSDVAVRVDVKYSVRVILALGQIIRIIFVSKLLMC